MKKALIIVLLFNLLRFAFLPFLGLTPQEAYFTFCSEHPSMSYFDFPPLTSYLVMIFTALMGKNILALKIGAFVVMALAQVAFFIFSSKVLRGRQRYTAWILFSSSLMVATISCVTCPDVLLILFWIVSISALYGAIFEGKKAQWIVAGICLGLAFDSKYPAVMLLVGLVLFLVFSAKYRRHLATPWPYMALMIAVILAEPVLIWNIEHDFVSFSLASTERAEPFENFVPQNIAGLGLTQMALLLPLVWIGLWWLVGKYFWRIFTDPNRVNVELWFLFCFFMPMFIGVYLISIVAPVKFNWLMPAYVSGIVLLSRFVDIRFLKWHIALAAVAHIAVVFAMSTSEQLKQSLGFDAQMLSQKIDSVHQQNSNAFILTVDGYQTAAKLSFFLNDTIYGPQTIDQRAYHFAYVGQDVEQLKGRNAILVRPMKHRQMQQHQILPFFESTKKLTSIKMNGVTAYEVYFCTNYKGIN
ncbi:MAG: glycosyltransferase family 39 protein [Salinivirgaceae bacterium]|nr:glycosyltransferase family 39 protein [Salinivirgaceae bacterium]